MASSVASKKQKKSDKSSLSDLKTLGHQLLSSRAHVNNLPLLLSFITPCTRPKYALESLLSLQSFFTPLLPQLPSSTLSSSFTSDSQGDPEFIYRTWVRSKFDDFVQSLLDIVICSQTDEALREVVLDTLMEFVKVGNGGKFHSAIYHRLLHSIKKMTNSSEVNVGTTSATVPSTAPSNRSTVAPTIPPAEKPAKFTGVDFKRWQQKMFFYLTTLSLQRFINENVPILAEGTPDNERLLVTDAWTHSDFLCRNYILSCLQDDLYSVYSNLKTSKELWDALEKKYKTEDAGMKKFIVAKFLDYKMVDSKTVVTQVQELQVIIHDLLAEGLIVNDAFQVAAIIEKLPPLWKDFKNYLKHKRKEMSVEDLIVRLRIEEDNKAAEKRSQRNSTIAGANIVEEGPNVKKRKKPYGSKDNPPKKRFKGNCHNCGKAGHKAVDCRSSKKQKKKNQANMIEKNEEVEHLCAMLTQCNLVGNPKEWWLDSGATSHVCAVKEAFATYAPAAPDETMYMGNSSTAKVEGYGKVCLKMTSGKVVTLNRVCHVPEMRKNLVSAGLMIKNGFKCVLVSDKVVISKNEMYVGKDYLTEGLFKLK